MVLNIFCFKYDKQLNILVKGILTWNLLVDFLKFLFSYLEEKKFFWTTFRIILVLGLSIIFFNLCIIGYDQTVKVVIESFNIVLKFIVIMVAFLYIMLISKNYLNCRIQKEKLDLIKLLKPDNKFYINCLVLYIILVVIIIAFLNKLYISKYIVVVASLYINYLVDGL